MTSKIGKRPLRSLSAHEKMDAIRRVHDGESKASVARDIGVPESTLRGWCKNEDKILYLSRQSTPETDESEPRDKKQRYEPAPLTNGIEPYNLSVKVDSPQEVKQDNDAALNLTKDQPSPNVTSTAPTMSERERNRAELTRLSIELGLNRPEMFLPQMNLSNSITDGLMAQWNQATSQVVNQAVNQAVSAINKTKLRHSLPPTQNILPTPHIQLPAAKSPKPKDKLPEAPPVDDSVWHWLKTQQAMLGLVSQNSPGVDPNSSWFWKWYKQFAYTPQTSQDSTVLYQQLTKDSNLENQAKNIEKPIKAQNNKARAVLDNLLLNNNNNEVSALMVARPEVKKEKEATNDEGELITPSEALEHGEKFLKWLESFSDPSVTAMQVLQFRYLLNNVRSCTDRKNLSDTPKMKVKRK